MCISIIHGTKLYLCDAPKGISHHIVFIVLQFSDKQHALDNTFSSQYNEL